VKTWDVIISGAGIIGVSLALELRQRGAQVLVLDCSEPGKEASSAAAGMLSPVDPETPEKLRTLARESADMYPLFVEKLEGSSGMKVDFRQGAIALLKSPQELPDYKLISPVALKQLEPALDARGYPAYLISENSVDPDLVMRAALHTAHKAGVEIRGHTTVRQMSNTGAQVEVIAARDRFLARAAVNCQGAWAGAPVRPRKGQMLYLQPQNPALLSRVVRAPEVYLVPRSSEKILVGATVEDTGYDKTVAPEAIQELHHAAAKLVPELASAPIIASWAGLRPGTPDDLPILGQTETPSVFIAGGHFRNGILLAPITARIMADLIAGKTPALDISAFSPSRFVLSSSRSC
jgi:glycine oxidase